MTLPELHISMYSDIPLTRGLGSSASAIVGALVAANALEAARFPKIGCFRWLQSLKGILIMWEPLSSAASSSPLGTETCCEDSN